MKSKIIFWSTKFAILVLFLTLSIPASTQPYQPIIAADSTSWDVAHQELFGIVMEQLYTKKHPDSTYSKLFLFGLYPDTVYIGKVREDINSGKIWYVNPYSNDEKLIMNMSLIVGDTFQISTTWSSVDSVFFHDGKKIIRFDLQTIWDETVEFIEGVGPNVSLIYALDPGYDHFYVACKYNADALVYVNNNINFIGCEPNTIGFPDKSKTKTINMYPNPATTELHIELPKEFHPKSELILRDITGQIIKQKTLIGNKHIIFLSKINQGIYIVTIINKSYIYYQTIVITN